MTQVQLLKKTAQARAAFVPRRVEMLTGSTHVSHQYLNNRMAEMLSWLENEIQHSRVHADMEFQRLAKIKVRIHRASLEDSTRDLGTLDFERYGTAL
jgi:hypothetical protein